MLQVIVVIYTMSIVKMISNVLELNLTTIRYCSLCFQSFSYRGAVTPICCHDLHNINLLLSCRRCHTQQNASTSIWDAEALSELAASDEGDTSEKKRDIIVGTDVSNNSTVAI